MPSLVLQTNVKVPDVGAWANEFSKLSAEFLGKPELYISVSYNYDENLSFGGTFEPAFLLTITSLDNINPEVNEKYSKIIFDHFQKTLGTPGNRGYVVFNDPGRDFMGHKGTTVAAIFGN
ncbi:Tautomerase/MIF [Punctularia strigosozonata HHB-11173 SS5]|uniref:L-dopachrome isomerase n=1 Tax=Punctularia strigosozonata (strain HHB-11173) TaxID=741275 RepID=R7S4Q5_PUNST|nr:Tautomerase/MIF [Punctularia strigosozonata HHB-11173 SS5]EIN04787.1 Tautomerase/MIF [Punctularia strigosozonata HHB-11173 SS5]